eukprot:Gb_34753 [translate_table: standard]
MHALDLGFHMLGSCYGCLKATRLEDHALEAKQDAIINIIFFTIAINIMFIVQSILSGILIISASLCCSCSWKSDMENNASASTQPAEADAPWKPRTSLPADRKRVFKTVIGILNEMTPQTFDIQEERLLNSGINSADILQGVAIIVYDKTISETQLFPMYAKLCGNLAKVAPQFPPDEPNGLIISFTRILLNICQEAFEDASELNTGTESSTTPEQAVESNSKLRVLRNIRLIGELFNQKVIPGKIVHHCIQRRVSSASRF